VISAITVVVLGALGAFFILSAVLGALRFPDVFTRMHAVTKAGTLGVGLFMAATAVHFSPDVSLVTRALGVIVFTLLTAPTSAQMLGRAAYLSGAEPAPETEIDEFAEHVRAELEASPPADSVEQRQATGEDVTR
jgi:multicomponent Na+:H+ antiporter subunit G